MANNERTDIISQAESWVKNYWPETAATLLLATAILGRGRMGREARELMEKTERNGIKLAEDIGPPERAIGRASEAVFDSLTDPVAKWPASIYEGSTTRNFDFTIRSGLETSALKWNATAPAANLDATVYRGSLSDEVLRILGEKKVGPPDLVDPASKWFASIHGSPTTGNFNGLASGEDSFLDMKPTALRWNAAFFEGSTKRISVSFFPKDGV
jgi:hypothetical protein